MMTANTMSSFRLKTLLGANNPLRDSPLPKLNWADSREVWKLMLQKEDMYVRNADVLLRHPALQERMRSILLDWLIEVTRNFY